MNDYTVTVGGREGSEFEYVLNNFIDFTVGYTVSVQDLITDANAWDNVRGDNYFYLSYHRPGLVMVRKMKWTRIAGTKREREANG